MTKSLKKQKPDRFQSKHAILVEGRDDLEFIVSFLKKLEIDDKIYVHEVGGISGIFGSDDRSLKMIIKHSHFKKNVRNLAIIFDEDGKKNRFEKIIKDIEKLNKENDDINFIILNGGITLSSKSTKPITISISIDLLKPDLETLILKSLDNKKYEEIIEKPEGPPLDKDKEKEYIKKPLDDELNMGTILSRLDGIGNYNGLIIIATTNCKDSLSPALYRYGRLDPIFFDYAKQKDIINMIESHFKINLELEQKEKIIKESTFSQSYIRSILDNNYDIENILLTFSIK